MRIEVKQEHIAKGRRQSCYKCPIALAISEAMNVENPEVGSGRVRIGDVYYWLPSEAKDFINRFDAKYPPAVGPFSFELSGPKKIETQYIEHWTV